MPTPERFVLTARTGVTDPMLIFGGRHLRRVPAQYQAHYNGRRPHRSRQLCPLAPDHPDADLSQVRVKPPPVPGGLINEYERTAQKAQVNHSGRVLEPHRVKESLRQPANLAAAIGYYRAAGGYYRALGVQDPPGNSSGGAARYAAEQEAAGRQAPQPTLYLHGADDGCIRVELARGTERLLAPSSRMVVIEHAGHLLQLERPGEVNNHILAWVTG
jgi:pimeloyl-ACP methyl ester carboxylesterase